MGLTLPAWFRNAVVHPAFTAAAVTWKITTVRGESFDTDRPTVYLFWHEVILPMLWHHRNHGVEVVISESKDGQYVADLVTALGYGVVRGSSSSGASRALLSAVRSLQAGRSVAFTPDGPRGPRRVLKPGALAAAQRAGAHVVPTHAHADRSWRLNSWDRFLIPKPFARIELSYGEPLTIEPGTEGLEAGRVAVEETLAKLASEGNGEKAP